ncbi:uracil-DNA glycosylase family protein [uncultured Thiodictyon sp.]|uniref:uracil-DNA glycosylase family protein n=1 Tax=uncultured Thiodictyon sp. TaxID=1846217 RepID=UPI0025FF4817|nr:uracil-DNA glycosylase family protein [uncultured Thiodictyon sp.]
MAGSDQTVDESRRRAYLQAMGIEAWVPRAGVSPPVAAPSSGPHRAAPPVVDLIEPTPPRVAAAPLVTPPPEVPPTPAQDRQPPPEPGSTWEPVWESAWEPVWEPPPGLATPPATASSTVPAKHAVPADVADPAPLLEDPGALTWDALATAVAGCRACALCETRTQTVFGVGDRQARLLVIGEAPGADEDREGQPFVGRAGRLLTQMLAAIGLARDQVYIANILKCRPPNNRNPHPGEVQHCHGYLARQVELIQPRAILAVGAVAAQNLLGTDTPVGRLRGHWFDYGPAAIALRVTYHPAYLLRSPDQKAKAWEDLIEVARRLRAAS